MSPHLLFSLAFHTYAIAAIAYLAHLARPFRPFVYVARASLALGLALHGWGLAERFTAQDGLLRGLSEGFSGVVFLMLALCFFLDLRYRMPVVGAFLAPAALVVWIPTLWLHGSDAAPPLSPLVRQEVLPVHIAAALAGIAAFAVAVAVGGLYLVLERQVKRKQFGLLFSRLPSLQRLDEVNRQLVVVGFIALSLTLVTGAFFVNGDGPFWAWRAKEVGTVVAWCVFAGLLGARLWGGWQGRRMVFLTVVGFAVVLVCFFSSYSLGVPAALGAVR